MDPDGFDLDLDRRALLEEFETWTEWPMAVWRLPESPCWSSS